MSKFYGETERTLGKIFALARDLSRSAEYRCVILFLDEIDALATTRGRAVIVCEERRRPGRRGRGESDDGKEGQGGSD